MPLVLANSIRVLSLISSLALTSLAIAQDETAPTPPPASASSPITLDQTRAELEAMHDTDQQTRKQIVELGKTQDINSPEIQALWKKQNEIDAYNIERLEAIIARFGWPRKTEFGKKAAGAAFLVLQHSDLEYQKKYVPLVRQAAAEGEIPLSSVALLEDRILVREGLPQIYGSQARKNTAGELELSPIEDEENVDARRASVGLGPLAEYLKKLAEHNGGKLSPKWAERVGKEN